MKNNKENQDKFEKGFFVDSKSLEETKGEKNSWWEDGFVDKYDNSTLDMKRLSDKELSFEMGFLNEMPISQMKMPNTKPRKKAIKAKYFGILDSNSETIWAEDFFRSNTGIKNGDFDATVVGYHINSNSCEITLGFKGEFDNYFFVNYFKEADTMKELFQQINEDFNAWDEYDTEHDLNQLLGTKYKITVDKDSEHYPLIIKWEIKRRNNNAR